MLPGIDSVDIDLKGATVDVGFNPAAVGLDTITEALADIGYPATGTSTTSGV